MLLELIENKKEIERLIALPSEKWKEFDIACSHFDIRKFQYIFISPENLADDEYTVEAFAKLPWRLVLDFNSKTDENKNGLLYNFNKIVGQGKKKTFTVKDKIEFDQNFPHYWFLINGQGSILPSSNYKSWRSQYKNFLSNQLYHQFLKGSRIKSRIVVLLNIPSKYAQDIIDEFNRLDEINLHFVLCSETENYENIFDAFNNIQLVKISAGEIANGVHNSINFLQETIEDNILIPHKDDSNVRTFISISKDHYEYLHSLGIEIIYKGIEKSILSDDTNSFYRGGTITWRDLAEQKDRMRSNLPAIQKRLEFHLNENKLEDIQLIHEGGAGGTTLARRIAYNLSTLYPTLLIRKYIHKKTISALRIIYDQYTKGVLPLLIITESFEVKDNHLLYRDLSNAKKNAVTLIVHRGVLAKAKNKKFTLKAQLEGSEINAFESAYIALAPEHKDKIINITKDYRENTQYISPVLYALTAFGKDYNGLESYVVKSLEGTTLEQRKLTGFICIIYYYTQKSVPIELFSLMFGLDRSKCNLVELLGTENPLLELLHQETDENGEYYNYWRPRYALLGEEAMKIILSGGIEHKKNWKNQLGNWLVELIRQVRNSMPYLDEDTAQIFNSLFIERSHLDDNGHEKEFTKTFEDLTNENGILIFDTLIEAYPDEAHFHGHYARYLYSDKIGIRDYNKAINEAEASLHIAPENSSLKHTLGMCFKEKAENMIYSYESLGIAPDDAEEKIQILVEEACDKFDECIGIDPYNIYGYESQMRIILKTLDFGFKIHPAINKESFITNSKNNWYTDKLDKVSNLLEEALYTLEQLKRVDNKERIMKSESYILDLEGMFFKTLGQHLNAKTKFEELVKNTPKGYEYMRSHYRRMFVICLLASKTSSQRAIYQSWKGISEAELNQCIDYLDANIIEEPNKVQNIRLWLQAIRHLKSPPSIINVISRIGTWTQVTLQNINSLLEGYYYLYVLNSIKAISEGNTFDPTAVQIVKDVLEKMKPFVKNEKFCFEWYGKGSGLNQMINHKELGEFTADFFEKNKDKILEVTGRIRSIQSFQQGIIILDCGLEAFFVPSINGFTERNINDRVKFYVGFRYDQIQAWSVLLITEVRDQSKSDKEIVGLSVLAKNSEERTNENLVKSSMSVSTDYIPLPKLKGPKILGSINLKDNKTINKKHTKHIAEKGHIYIGTIKVITNTGGYIEVDNLDKNIAFQKSSLFEIDFNMLSKGEKVKLIIKYVKEKALLDDSRRNYIAESVYKYI